MNYKELEHKYIEALEENTRLKYENRKLLEICSDNKNEWKTINLINYSYELEEIKKEIQQRKNELNKIKKKTTIAEEKKKTKIKKNKIPTKVYNDFRDSILKRDNYKCQMCGSDFRLQVHHIKPRSRYPELIMDRNNCITLCIVCHSKTESFMNG